MKNVNDYPGRDDDERIEAAIRENRRIKLSGACRDNFFRSADHGYGRPRSHLRRTVGANDLRP